MRTSDASASGTFSTPCTTSASNDCPSSSNSVTLSESVSANPDSPCVSPDCPPVRAPNPGWSNVTSSAVFARPRVLRCGFFALFLFAVLTRAEVAFLAAANFFFGFAACFALLFCFALLLFLLFFFFVGIAFFLRASTLPPCFASLAIQRHSHRWYPCHLYYNAVHTGRSASSRLSWPASRRFPS